ncbi:MAG TPA: response regulator [Chondromyces sp.]|nr:response regulator [Chondromyces sp.]
MTDETLRVIVVDDEGPARQLLREYLADVAGVTLIAECGNGFEAVKAAAELAPDLMLLDIQMPKLDGFEVVELLGDDVPVIFVTAHDEHALRAFEVHAVDYLLKPVSAERLAEAVERARERIGRGEPAAPLEELAEDAQPERGTLERILIRDGSEVRVVPVDAVDFIEARDDAVAIHSGSAVHLKAQRLAALEARLDPSRFVRVHRSYILNVERLRSLELYAKDSRIAILADGRKVPVSRAGYQRLRELL